MHPRRHTTLLAFVALLLAMVWPESAHAAPYDCQAYQTLYAWYGVSGSTYTYGGWDAAKHVSSFYAHAPDGDDYGRFNYIEAGLTGYCADYASRFVAYENFPDTLMDPENHTGQVQIFGYAQPINTWAYCEINNHALGGSDWYAAVGGQTLLHGLTLWNVDYRYPYTRTPCAQTRLRSTAERWDGLGYGVDNRMSSYLHRMKDSKGAWYNWSSLVNSDADNYWDPYKVSNTYWYTVYNTVYP
jgi:hypothetical protein